MTSPFTDRLTNAARTTEDVLAGLFDDSHGGNRPERLTAAMRHAVLAGGKRLRPFLVIETARLFDIEGRAVLQAAAAIELVHCYSLVHDDLPSMDDDDLRRGQPTVHRAFDEATAILVGDALQTLAFHLLGNPDSGLAPDVALDLVALLAQASGGEGMVGGQMLDLAAEGRFSETGRPLDLEEGDIARLQAMKTGALIRCAVEMGARLGKADAREKQALADYGTALGQAFQIADDLLDTEADALTVGKATGKDAARGKATLVGLWGAERARAHLADLIARADAALAPFGERAALLRETAVFVGNRRN